MGIAWGGTIGQTSEVVCTSREPPSRPCGRSPGIHILQAVRPPHHKSSNSIYGWKEDEGTSSDEFGDGRNSMSLSASSQIRTHRRFLQSPQYTSYAYGSVRSSALSTLVPWVSPSMAYASRKQGGDLLCVGRVALSATHLYLPLSVNTSLKRPYLLCSCIEIVNSTSGR